MASIFDKIPPEHREAFFRGLPTGDIEWLKKIIQYQQEVNEGEVDIRLFFFEALVGYYDAMWEGLDRTTGHLLYRLSDFVPKEEREIMMIYPSSDGSIINEKGDVWDSLEDWRKHWEKSHPLIPELPGLFKKLPSGIKPALPEGENNK